MPSEPDMIWIEIFLRQIVPLFYLFCCIYLGLEIGGRTRLKYAMAFGLVGGIGYIVLNEPGWATGALFFTPNLWVIILLFAALILGVVLFQLVLEVEDIDGPIQRAKTAWEWVRNFFSR